MKKEEVSELLNELLGTNIKFEKLSKSELMELYSVLNDPQKILDILYENLGFDNFVKEFKEFCKRKTFEKKPIRTFLKDIILK